MRDRVSAGPLPLQRARHKLASLQSGPSTPTSNLSTEISALDLRQDREGVTVNLEVGFHRWAHALFSCQVAFELLQFDLVHRLLRQPLQMPPGRTLSPRLLGFRVWVKLLQNMDRTATRRRGERMGRVCRMRELQRPDHFTDSGLMGFRVWGI